MSIHIKLGLSEEVSDWLVDFTRRAELGNNKRFSLSNMVSQMVVYSLGEESGFKPNPKLGVGLSSNLLKRIRIRMTDGAQAKIRARAGAAGENMSFFIRELMVGWEPDIEDYKACLDQSHTADNSYPLTIFISEESIEELTRAAATLSTAHAMKVSNLMLLRGHIYRTLDKPLTPLALVRNDVANDLSVESLEKAREAMLPDKSDNN